MNQMFLFNRHVDLPDMEMSFGTGWLPPLPDMRDYTLQHPDVAVSHKSLGLKKDIQLTAIPARMDLTPNCSPIENQGNLGSCTANAAVGVIEYMERRGFGHHVDGSRLYVYKTTRDLMGVIGDTGAWLRTTMAALVFFGLPPENYWSYTDRQQPGPNEERTFDIEPPAFVYALAEHYGPLTYFCYDPLGTNVPAATVLNTVKTYIAAGIPSMFGFFGFPSFGNVDIPGGIPFPGTGEQVAWGHAVGAFGYDDNLVITNTKYNLKTKGALLIRNSWGTGWGNKGYGWLPYEYVLRGLALDFWSLTSTRWVDTHNFGIQALEGMAVAH